MKTRFYKNSRGQSVVEYAIIGVIVLIALVASSRGIGILMKDQVDSSAQGLSSGKHIKD